MAITLTTILGTDSVAATRITINDNFSTVKSAINSILSMIDITTGAFDNSAYSSSNSVKTSSIQITTGSLTLNNGNIVVTAGNINLNGTAPQIDFGTSARIALSSVGHTGAVTTIPILDLSALNNGGVKLPYVPEIGTTGWVGYTGSDGLVIVDSTNHRLLVRSNNHWYTATGTLVL